MEDAVRIIRLDESIPSEEYARFAICREMGWDYHVYESQPPFFLEQIEIFLIQEAGKSDHEVKKLEKSKKTQGLQR